MTEYLLRLGRAEITLTVRDADDAAMSRLIGVLIAAVKAAGGSAARRTFAEEEI